ncbi:MAG: DUF1570 domain-containing protein [Pirellulaceae bacterium]
MEWIQKIRFAIHCVRGAHSFAKRTLSVTLLIFYLATITPATLLSQEVKTTEIEFRTKRVDRNTIGEVLVEDPQGNIVLLTPDGRLWPLHAEEIVSREETVESMKPLSQDEIFAKIKEELPQGVSVIRKKHYVIVYNSTRDYANYVGAQFELVYKNFRNYWWSHHRIRLEEPRFPLVALVFRDRNSYLKYAVPDVGKQTAEQTIGYYNQESNLMVTYNINAQQGAGLKSAERNLATIVHEAVHQMAYNSGLQVRLADNPRWLSEGLAMFFESPTMRQVRGKVTITWKMGEVNRHNLFKFRQAKSQRLIKPGTLNLLVANDDWFLSNGEVSYPYSWALTYFLMKKNKESFSKYVQELAEYPTLNAVPEPQRVAVFKKHFGEDLAGLEIEMVKYISAL